MLMRHLCFLLLLTLAGPAAAQFIPNAPGAQFNGVGGGSAPAGPAAPVVRLPPTSFKNGSYQLLAGAWQRGKLLYDASTLSVSDASHGTQYPQVYAADSVRAFVLGRDTFQLVRGVELPRPAERRRATFARRLYRRGGFEVTELVVGLPAPASPIVYTLVGRPGQLSPAVLPPNRVLFRLALAKALADYPALSQQLELDAGLLPEQLPELLSAYGSWRARQASAAK